MIFANSAAEAEFRTGGYLDVVEKRLQPSASVREFRACKQVLQSLQEGRAGTVLLTHRETGRNVVLSTAPCAASDALAACNALRGLVWLTALLPSLSGVSRLSGLFGLTVGETRLLSHFVREGSLAAAAATLGISIHTARTQLKAVHQKTGWHSQTLLMRMVQQLALISSAPSLG